MDKAHQPVETIDRFDGPWEFLSNYFPARVVLDGCVYPTVEHAYQAAKTNDAARRDEIARVPDPDLAKQLGRASVHRPDWGEVRLPIMRSLVFAKFADSGLRQRLLATGSALLVEGNDWRDTFWGVCAGQGTNHMGRILMAARAGARADLPGNDTLSAATRLASRVHRVAETELPTRFGRFTAIGYRGLFDACEFVALVAGTVRGTDSVQVRVHSECLTGEAFGSLRCDCGPQLEAAMRAIVADGCGVVLYLRGHEGRGIGLLAKLRAYQLQAAGYDTVDANLALGLPADARDYRVAVEILADLGVRSIRLLSNNPDKQRALAGMGVCVVDRVPLITATSAESLPYLRTKRDRMSHDLPALPGVDRAA